VSWKCIARLPSALRRDRAQQLPRLQRRADADGVAERDFVAAEVPQHFGDIDHRLRLDLALIGQPSTQEM
jgi:hypothetical protein